MRPKAHHTVLFVTKGVIRIHKSKERQHNGQKEKEQRFINMHIKLKYEKLLRNKQIKIYLAININIFI
jgi:hypothetical protein